MSAAPEIRDALRWVSPDCERDTWVRVLMAVKAALGDAGRDVAEAWSQQSDRYSARAFADTWRSIREGGGITAASLFKLAREAGMRPDEAPPVAFDPVPRGARQRAEPERSTADYARDIWARVARSDAAVAAHPYGVRKRIRHAAGAGRATVSGRLIGRNADCLVVPYRTLDGELVGVEVINEAGAKQTFGSKGVLVLGNDREPALTQFVVEGWASAARLVFAMNRGNACAYVAGSKGRLERVARQVAERFPARQVVICAEVDHA